MSYDFWDPDSADLRQGRTRFLQKKSGQKSLCPDLKTVYQMPQPGFCLKRGMMSSCVCGMGISS